MGKIMFIALHKRLLNKNKIVTVFMIMFYFVAIYSMQYIYPKKLKKGDKIMVIAPARSFKLLSEDTVTRAIERLNDLGLEVVFGKHIAECDELMSSSIESRVEDLHDAFRDKSIAGILSVI